MILFQIPDKSTWSRQNGSDRQFNPLTPTGVIMDTAIKHPVPDRVKLSFVIFDIRTL